MPNEALFIETLAHVVAFPESWDQGNWINPRTSPPLHEPFTPPCGTTFCVAGRVAALDGLKFMYTGGYLNAFIKVIPPDGVPRKVAHYAAERLGLSIADAHVLFDSYNDLDTIFQLVAEFLEPLSEAVLRDKVYDRARQLSPASLA